MSLREEAPSNRIFVTNLDSGVTENHLFELFSGVGTVVSVVRKPQGYAFVEFDGPDPVKQALAELIGTPLLGRNLRIERAYGRARATGPASPFARGSSGSGVSGSRGDGDANGHGPVRGAGREGCFNCGSRDHWLRDCPTAGASGRNRCFNCLEVGHIAKQCPHPHGYRHMVQRQASGEDRFGASSDRRARRSRSRSRERRRERRRSRSRSRGRGRSRGDRYGGAAGGGAGASRRRRSRSRSRSRGRDRDRDRDRDRRRSRSRSRSRGRDHRGSPVQAAASSIPALPVPPPGHQLVQISTPGGQMQYAFMPIAAPAVVAASGGQADGSGAGAGAAPPRENGAEGDGGGWGDVVPQQAAQQPSAQAVQYVDANGNVVGMAAQRVGVAQQQHMVMHAVPQQVMYQRAVQGDNRHRSRSRSHERRHRRGRSRSRSRSRGRRDRDRDREHDRHDRRRHY